MRSRTVSMSLVGLVAVVSLLIPARAVGANDGSDVVVANRGSANLSVVGIGDLSVDTVDLPGSEPMYVSHDAKSGRVFVGDRANDEVIVLDDQSYDVEATVPVGAGVFHQWTDGRQLWVVGDVDDTVSVIDPGTLDLLATITLPADVVAAGGSPHDVFVQGRHAFVSIVGLADGGLVIRYSTKTFAETGRIEVGGDPHLFIRSGRLYVASQDASSVSVFHPGSLRSLSTTQVPAAHGIWIAGGNRVFVSNIAGGGSDAVFSLDRRLGRVFDTTETNFPVPHNLAFDNRTDTLFVTHSGGTADQLSVVDLDGNTFGHVDSVTVGTNPFGLAIVD